MHMLFRTLLIFLKKPFFKRVHSSEKTVVSMRVLPTDLDILMHVNNGVYFSLMDFGRWDMVFRNGIYDICKKQGWYAVVAGEAIKFKKSLSLWQKFQLETQIIGYDEKYFFIRQKFIYKGELMVTGLVKVRFLKKKGGTVEINDILDLTKIKEILSEAEGLSNDWYALEKTYLA